MRIDIRLGDCLDLLPDMEAESVDLIYLDPPFNIGKGRNSFSDKWASVEKYIDFIGFRIAAMHRALSPKGTIYLQCSYEYSHLIRFRLDKIFGRENCLNQIVWSYGLGRSSPSKYSVKHEVILFYAKSEGYIFNKPKVPSSSAAMRGRLKGCEDVWTDIPALNNMAKERTGYPTQKPLALLRRIIEASSNPGDLVLDPFCGSGTTGVAALELGRRFIGMDINADAVEITRRRCDEI